MVETFDIRPVHSEGISKTWWQLTLLSVGCAALLIGILHAVVKTIRKTRRAVVQQLQERETNRLFLEVKDYFHCINTIPFKPSVIDEKPKNVKPTSCRIYLGPIDKNPSENQLRILSGYDIIIVDPLQPGVNNAVRSPRHKNTARQILGRLDLPQLVRVEKDHISTVRAIGIILEVVNGNLHCPNNKNNGYTGIVLGNWENFFSAPIIHELSKELVTRGLDVYLETQSPKFLTEIEAIGSSQISGLVVRNGLLWPNGDRRDCFDLDGMRPTIKAFMAQDCLRPFTTVMWEELDNDAVVSTAVLRRTYSWNKFHSTVSWVSSTDALLDANTPVSTIMPLSAFSWLKGANVIRLHSLWRENQTVSADESQLASLHEILPTLKALESNVCETCGLSDGGDVGEVDHEEPLWAGLNHPKKIDTLSVSETGLKLDRKGCFPIGIDINEADFQQIVKSQRRLRRLELLDEVSQENLQEIGITLGTFLSSGSTSSSNISPHIKDAIRDLSHGLQSSLGNQTRNVHVYRGLDTGFHCTGTSRFWGVYSRRASSWDMDLYISTKSQDLIGTILHTYLSSRDCTRRQCFEVEYALAEWADSLSRNRKTTKRVQQDIDSLSPSEGLFVLQRFAIYEEAIESALIRTIYTEVRSRLIDHPSKAQLRSIGAVGFLYGSVNAEALIVSRMESYCQNNLRHISKSAATKLFLEVQEALGQMLRGRRPQDLEVLTEILEAAISSGADTTTDIVALAVFCFMRKLAFEEIYIEVTDRNPLFNDQSDQGAAFSELYALGSRCETYFDMTPSAFGKLLLQKFRDQYSDPLRQPPLYKETTVALQTAYSDPQIDISSKTTSIGMPSYQRFTFMGVFALPALIDVLLLTTTKHGLYFSARMTPDETKYATVAFMLALPISGAIGTWVACGGTYYLASMAFSAMNYFVITRLLGGFVFILILGAVGFIAISIVIGATQAVIFFLYFIALVTYLSLLASLANYNLNGSSFQSGRATIIACIPVLFISPLITIFVQGYDSQIYIATIYVFITLLLLGTRNVGSLWTIWWQNIYTIDDKTLKTWFLENKMGELTDDGIPFENLSEPALLNIARQELHRKVLKALPSLLKLREAKDQLVLRLAGSYQATLIMMDWYTLSTGLPQPVPYSSTWNVQCKVALKLLKESQRGIRFHNGFLHWRQAGDEIGCTILYFAIALLDKWIALLTGRQSIDGQSGSNSSLIGFVSTNPEFRFAIGFGLAYYLIGSVFLDHNFQKLNKIAAKTKQEIVKSDDALAHAIEAQGHARTALYWKTLRHYLLLHTWSLTATTALMLLLSESKEAVITYLAYVVAYSGLLWYQYTKTFSGPHALKPLLMSLCLALPVGFLLRHFFPRFIYTDVIALGVGTWSVAILSLWAVQIIGRTPDVPIKITENGYHALHIPGMDPAWSQDELRSNYELLRSLPADQHPQLAADSYQGQQVQQILLAASLGRLSDIATKAFPDSRALFKASAKAFQHGKVLVEIVSTNQLNTDVQSTRAISHVTPQGIRVLIVCNAELLCNQQQMAQHCLYNIADVVCHLVAENYFGYDHAHAGVAEYLLKDTSDPHLRIPHSFKCQIDFKKVDGKSSSATYYKNEMLRNLCLGLAPNIEWDSLPQKVRINLIQRVIGSQSSLTEGHKKYVQATLNIDNYEVYLARCDYAAYISALYYRDITRPSLMALHFSSREAANESLPIMLPGTNILTIFTIPRLAAGYVWHKAGQFSKFFAIAIIADGEYQRELNCSLARYSELVSTPIKLVFNGLWVMSKTIQSFLLPYFLFHNRKHVANLWKKVQGEEISFKRKHISIRTLDGQYTAFVHNGEGGAFELYQYRGEHKREPQSRADLAYINSYSKTMSLLSRQDIQDGNVVSAAEYEYKNIDEGIGKRLSRTNYPSPISRRITEGRDQYQKVNYNSKGFIESGSYFQDGNLIRFHYNYRKSSKMGAELLRAGFVLPHISCTVSWCTPPLRNSDKLEKWISYSEVTEASFVVGQDVWESKWTYDHRYHPTIATLLNGKSVETPPLIKYDHLNILSKPRKVSYHHDNPLDGFSTVKPYTIGRWMGLYKRSYRFRTSESRYWLWKAWKEDSEFDGVIVRWMDEQLLRRDESLRAYWRRRDWGYLSSAEKYLLANLDSISAKVDLDKTISSWTPLAIKMNDLLTFGPGGDASGRTRSRLTSQENEDDASLHVVAVDTGTWPNEGGGVSACRRDVINNLKTIKWHMVVESANDFGIPKHQIEKNVHSLKVIPIWGLDLMTPTHGLFENRFDSEIKHVPRRSDKEDIKKNFIPILATLVSGARSLTFVESDLKQMTRALVNLNTYFGEGRQPWRIVWNSKIVKNAWRRLWLAKFTPNARPCSEWFAAELPTLGQLDEGLELWSRYLFIFSIPLPEKMPDVFQASHHSVSASYGIICKVRRQCTLQIWDHAISWRETNLYLSSTSCPSAPFVRNSLLGLLRLTSTLTLHHADTILPCADFFNPGWEIEIGTCEGKIEHRNIFKRKVDPILNGITDMERFVPVEEITSKTPTVTMLSHVWFAKDIKTAILAADIIVNEWGFKDYKLDIYGAINKAPAYSTSCQEIISTKSLRQNVCLQGEADSMAVLQRTWVFMNSSVSEGLPLALGEAALTGAPVVCTDVGASLRVLTDLETNACYSAIVAPNDARALAKAQIHMLAMMGEWYAYSDEQVSRPTSPKSPESTTEPLHLTSLSDNPTKADVDFITRRMYDQTPARRRLGMMGRKIVVKTFDGARYLREHEQMLWVGKAQKDMRCGSGAKGGTLLREPSKLDMLANYQYSEIMGYRQLGKSSMPGSGPASFAAMSPAQTPTVPPSAFGLRMPSGQSVDTGIQSSLNIDSMLRLGSNSGSGTTLGDSATTAGGYVIGNE